MSGHGRSLTFSTMYNPTKINLRKKEIPTFLLNHNINATTSSIDELLYSNNIEADYVFIRLSFAVTDSTCGIALFELSSNVNGICLAKLKHICVHTTHRRCGYGTALLQQSLNVVAMRGVSIIVASTEGEASRGVIKLLAQNGFDKRSSDSDKFNYVKYIDEAQNRVITPPNSIAQPQSRIKTSHRRASREPGAKNTSKEIELEYWVQGSARKIARLSVPSYAEAESIIIGSSSSKSTMATTTTGAQLKSLPTKVASLICRERSLHSDHTVTLPLQELLSLRLASKWWYDLQSKKNQNYIKNTINVNDGDDDDNNDGDNNDGDGGDWSGRKSRRGDLTDSFLRSGISSVNRHSKTFYDSSILFQNDYSSNSSNEDDWNDEDNLRDSGRRKDKNDRRRRRKGSSNEKDGERKLI
jgi:GNAT superfamily N-acetyltransferase